MPDVPASRFDAIPEAIEATWPRAMVQTCVVHLIRASMRFVSYADRKAVAAMLKPINITVQYLAAGKSRTSYAAGRITKLGRRSANLTVEAWQDERSRPIATAVMNVLMAEPSG
mgnify:CR=1 FL=1